MTLEELVVVLTAQADQYTAAMTQAVSQLNQLSQAANLVNLRDPLQEAEPAAEEAAGGLDFINRLTTGLGANLAKLQRRLVSIKESLSQVGDAAIGTGVLFGLLGGAVTAGARAAVMQFNTMGDALDKMHTRTGVAVESLSRLGFAGELSGTSIQGVEVGLRFMSRTIIQAANGSKMANQTISRLGLSLDALKRQTPEQQFRTFADAISKIENPTQRSATAMQVFGRGGAQLLPLLLQGGAGLDAMAKKADELGVVMSKTASQQAAVLNDRLGELSAQTKAARNAIGEALTPALLQIIPTIQKVLAGVIGWIRQNQTLVTAIAGTFAVIGILGGGLVAIGTVIRTVTTAVTLASLAIGAFRTAVLYTVPALRALNFVLATLARNPFVAAAGLLVTALVTLLYFTRPNTDAMEGMSSALSSEAAAAEQAAAATKAMNEAFDEIEASPVATGPSQLEKAKESVAQVTDALQTQIATFGMGERQASLYNARLQVLKLPAEEQAQFAAQLERSAKAIQILEDREWAAALAKDLSEANVALRDQIRFFGDLTERQVQVMRLRERIAAMPRRTIQEWETVLALERQLEILIRQSVQMDQLERTAARRKFYEEEVNKSIRKQMGLIEDLRTPYEKLLARQAEIQQMLEEGLSPETAARAWNKALDEAAAAVGDRGMGDMGTFREIRTAFVDAKGLAIGATKDPVVGAVERQTDEQVKQTALLRELLRKGGLPL